MVFGFYLFSAVAVLSTALAVSRPNPVHALLYLVISFFSIALVIFVLGAPFAAALEVIIYAGAIMVLFLFVIMMLNVPVDSRIGGTFRSKFKTIFGPMVLGLLLFGEFLYIFLHERSDITLSGEIPPNTVGKELMKNYVLGVELASLLLLTSVIGAFQLGKKHN